MVTYPYGAVDGNRMAAVYDVLVWSDPATGIVRPQLADSFTSADGGRTWILRLRAGITFSDATPLDAEAVRFNWERHHDVTNHSLQYPATVDITSLQVTDPLTLRVVLSRPNANFDRIVARQLSFVGSPTAIRSDPVGVGRKPVGAGPYMLTDWAADGKQVYVRNPGYWQRDRGLPRFERLTMEVDPDAGHTADEVSAGRLDMSVMFAPDGVARAAERRLAVDQIHLDGGAMLMFNTVATPFGDPNVRKAVVLALSGADLNNTYFKGAGAVAHGIFSAASPVANGQLVMTENDPEQARALFAQITADGKRRLPFVMVVPNTPTLVKVAEHIRDVLNRFPGVDAQIQAADAVDFIRTVRKGDWTWNAALTQQWFSDPEPGVYDFLYSASSTNLTGYANPAVDKALDNARATVDLVARREAYTAVQMELNRDFPVWVYQESQAAAVSSPSIGGVELCDDGIVMWDRLERRV
ncbi:ABC transporter substrate-binding protein [Yinghuangia aomiensis]